MRAQLLSLYESAGSPLHRDLSRRAELAGLRVPPDRSPEGNRRWSDSLMQQWMDIVEAVGVVLALVAAILDLVTAVVANRRARRDL
jgi:hypothetical protein